jgi:hypothetical protein
MNGGKKQGVGRREERGRKEGQGREGKGREGKGREGKGGEGGEGGHPFLLYFLPSCLPSLLQPFQP